MKLTIDIDDDWPERVIRASALDGSNDAEHDLLEEAFVCVFNAIQNSEKDAVALWALIERRDNGEDLNS